MKKIISLFLAVLMICTGFTAVASAAYSPYSNVPIVYFNGKGDHIFRPDGSRVYPVATPDGYIMDAVKDCLPDLINALKDDTQENWNIYRDKLLSYVEPLYTDLRMDGNGNSKEGYHIDWAIDAGDIANKAAAYGGNYGIRAFDFHMDWRLDPFEIASQLRTYIGLVKQYTGASKVNLVVRCEANAMLAAYYSMYGYEDFNCVEMYVSSLAGCEEVSALFSGNIEITAAALTRFLDSYEENLKAGIENDGLTEFIYDTLYMLRETYTLDGVLLLLKPVINKLYQNAIAPAVLASYGTLPGIWTLVRADEYQDAKKWVFNGVENEYAGLIAKLDRYYNEVSTKYTGLLEASKAAGVKTAVYAKYGDYQLIPISSSNDKINDGVVALDGSSYGAITADYTEVLSDAYIANAQAKGTAKYISPDRKVDASTCVFPDTTWFIYNSTHKEFPNTIHDDLMMPFFTTNGTLTVWDDAALPQYIHSTTMNEYYICELTPLTAENGFQTETTPSTVNEIKVSVRDKVVAFVNSFWSVIRNFLIKLFNKEIKLNELV